MTDQIHSVLPVALYARLSVNPDGTSDSVATQLKQGRVECARRWPGRPVREYADDGITAGDDTVYRPDYERMLSDIRTRAVGDVITRTQARISRHEAIWPAFKVVCLASGIVMLHTWTEGDLSMVEGESLGGDVNNLLNAHLRKIVKKNVNQTLATRADEGRAHGGAPYGYKNLRDGNGVSHLVVVDTEAVYVIEMAERFLRGHSYADIARWLNDKDVPTKKGAKCWTGETVKGAITNATVTGLRVFKGQVVGEGQWDAILDRTTWEAVQAIANAPRQITRVLNGEEITQVVTGKKRPAQSYLLGQFCTCERCTARMTTGIVYGRKGTPSEGTRTPNYMCKSSRGGCNGLAIKAAETDEFVVDRFMDFLGSPAFMRYLRSSDKDRTKREKIQRQIKAQETISAENGEDRTNGLISREAFLAAEAKVAANVAGLRGQLLALTPAPVMDDPHLIRAGWGKLDLHEQTALLADFRTNVLIRRATTVKVVDRIEASFG